mmetsp:Transcript_11742/g.34668  ORF Transcript_11742/g.34668 Transcript_11742/m.34668 type:complete len:192 (+) Transcript_11742:391-966(+)
MSGKSQSTQMDEDKVVDYCGASGAKKANLTTPRLIITSKTGPYTTVSADATVEDTCLKVGAPTAGLTHLMLHLRMGDVEMDGDGDANNPDVTVLINASTKKNKFVSAFLPALAALALTGRMERRAAAIEDCINETGELRKELARDAARACLVRLARRVAGVARRRSSPAQADLPNKTTDEALATVGKANRV